MAEELCRHWEKVFEKKTIDRHMLQRWVETLRPSSERETSLPSSHEIAETGNPFGTKRRPRRSLSKDLADWTPRRQDTIKAIRSAGNSSPGPDGITFAVWRKLGELGIKTLHDMAVSLRDPNVKDNMQKAYEDEGEGEEHDYNLSTLVCLPKAAAGEDPDFGAY